MKKQNFRITAVLCAFGLISGVQGLPALASEDFSFGQLSNLTFAFSSGVGAWGTTLTISSDGSFEGTYSDSDMGNSGEEYPNGTVYLSEFQGQFSEPSRVNDYTYSVEIREMTLAEDVGTSEIIDGTRYVYSEPYGLDGAEELLFYLPGAPLDELPQAYRSWVGYNDLSATEDTELPFTGLYNVAAESGFSSYEQIAQDSGIEGELAAIEAQAAELETRINEGALSQSELTQAAGELYSLWDAELNSIWERIGALLPKEEMAQLTSEELAWIQEKETAVAQAGAEFEGGSMQPFIENSTAARLTRERVYELAVYLGYTGESDGGQTDSATAYGLEPDTDYMLDFDGDGTQERFSFSTYTQENDGMSRAVLELSMNGQTVWSVTDEAWSYQWRVSHWTAEDGSVYLAACSSSDNDWTSQALLLEYTGDSFAPLADLCALTRKSEDTPDNLLSAWARVSGVTAAEGNTVTLTWTETLMSAGIVSVPVTYEITGGQVTQNADPIPLDAQKVWTSGRTFEVMTEPGSDTALFQVSPGETVSLTGLTGVSGQSWIRCRNSQGQEGWFPDPEEPISEIAADGTWVYGYFQESMFAG